ncbi:MAG: uroporphyrinogen decarboxylase [Alphaproteobacteria bacterium]|nr:uroporphyrinogen decarboxylase [Alphaproteobacteria bacterium]
MDRPLLLRALAGEPLPRPPVWFMRQAGRYMPVYRELRQKVSFLDLCADGDLCAEVTLQPLRRFPFDAGIVFSDILLPLDTMGLGLSFGKGMGPRLSNPVRSAADVAALKSFDPVRDCPAPLQALRILDEAADVPILGFAGAPFTMACYAVEGGGSKDWIETKKLMWRDPAAFQRLLDTLADAVGDHLQAQVEAGAKAVQLFDTWAGALSVDDLRRWALPAAARALSRVKGAPTLYFTRDSGPFLPWLHEAGSDAIGLDWRVDMAHARGILGPDVPVQGNLDPIALYAGHDELVARTNAICRAAGPRGHVFNLGHGITPATPMDAVDTVIAAVRAFRHDGVEAAG